MSVSQHWILNCDMRTCESRFIGEPNRRSSRGLWTAAKLKGWGRMAIGKFGHTIHLCSICRVALQKNDSPKMFYQDIVSRDHSPDHTILLECGHEFGQGVKVESDTMDCPACFRAWLVTGEIEGVPAITDLLPQIPEDD